MFVAFFNEKAISLILQYGKLEKLVTDKQTDRRTWKFVLLQNSVQFIESHNPLGLFAL